jgi:hypothetical protein|tara:strand:+ start:6287 stop:6595 length:309 start_codon:yes stop_codon:yes gene_type:complete
MCEEENIEIGDLVRLEDDEDYIIGIGIVIDVAADSRSVINEFYGPIDYCEPDSFMEEKLYLHSPVYLVLWSGDKNYFSDDLITRPLWFFKNELKLVNKASRN